MDDAAQEQFTSEAGNWLSRGRSHVLDGILRRHLAAGAERRLLDIGAGMGACIDTLHQFGSVDAVEISEPFADYLEGLESVERVHRAPIPALKLGEHYNAIVAMDVMEHIDDDYDAIAWVHDHLVPGGLVIVSVPAYQWLFSDHDRALHHYRRYTRARLTDLLRSKLEVTQVSYFNSLLFPLAVGTRLSWQLARYIRGTATTPTKQRSRSGLLDPFFGRILVWEATRLALGRSAPFGLSVVGVATRRG